MYNESVSYQCHSVGLGWEFKILGFRVAHSVAYPPEFFFTTFFYDAETCQP